ncbi:hypothetical protein I6N95_19565 [Vagococcus sp. BWB3-3]|uniref:Uncharacterized protein n=1 Tax=Vagococcus allomyrinae TaxID=2794353 RepID=A0A940P8B8_9ENTE|nr:hypothetical protein [Vagococcus allomyrinae]MBP1043222.1 hypothetical protein [Vagococcus allomyrinae]
MGLFKRLFGEKERITHRLEEPVQSKWQEVAPYIPADKSEQQLVSLIGTGIAAGDNPTSHFVVKRLLKRNPEVQLVAVIATSLATGDQPESVFRVTSIKEEKLGGSHDVAQV